MQGLAPVNSWEADKLLQYLHWHRHRFVDFYFTTLRPSNVGMPGKKRFPSVHIFRLQYRVSNGTLIA